MSQAKRWHVLAAVLEQLDAKVFVEVGCKDGENAANVLGLAPKDMAYIGIDPWVKAPGQADLLTRMADAGAETYESWDFEKMATDFERHTYPYASRVTLKRCTSLEAVGDFADGSLDLVFIDGAHDEESVAEDIAAWLPKIRSGGVLAGADYNQKSPGVMRAVAAQIGLLDVAISEESVWLHYIQVTNAP